MCTSPLQTNSTAQRRGQGASYTFGLVRLPSRWSATVFIACILLPENHAVFNSLTFSNLNSRTGYPSTSTYSFDILIHVVAYNGLSEATKLIQTWFPHVAVDTSLSPRFGPSEGGSLAKLGSLGHYSVAIF